MNARQLRGSLLVLSLVSLALTSVSVRAATSEPIQTLDRVVVYGAGRAVEMPFDKPAGASVQSYPNVVAKTGFQICKLTTTDGLYCLDGQQVIQWANPLDASASGAGATLFTCDPKDNTLPQVPGLVACTGMTLDDSGNIWLAGQNKKKTYNLVKVITAAPTSADACPDPAGWQPMGAGYFACSWDTGRPLLVDITAIDGKAAEAFYLGAGIIGVEQRKTVTFFPIAPYAAPYEIASGKNGWGLSGNEQLQSAAVLPAQQLVLVTTSKARILGHNVTDGSLVAKCVEPDVNATACTPSGSATYGIRSSDKTGYLYVTDYDAHQTIEINPAGNWTEITRESTDGPNSETLAPLGPTIAAGIGVDMQTCSGGNVSAPDGSNSQPCQPVTGAFLAIPSSTLVTGVNGETPSGLTLFKVEGLPDCRWILWDPGQGNNPAYSLCASEKSSVIVDVTPSGVEHTPATQYLNVKPLLPDDVQKALAALEASGVNVGSQLLVSPTYRAQPDNKYLFDAFFAIPEKGVQFRDVIGLAFNVADLTPTKNELGCKLASELPPGYSTQTLLNWDVVTKLSEQVPTADAQYFASGDNYLDTLINTGCGSSRGTSFGFSLISFNLEISPATTAIEPTSSGYNFQYCPANGAVFGELLNKLYSDLEVVTGRFACTADANGNQPIDAVTCSTLEAQLSNGQDKLQKCIAATYQPKTSSGNQNCQSFVSQFNNVVNTVQSTLEPAYIAAYPNTDPDNRRGDLKARLQTIFHVYTDKFVPSIPSGGFTRDTYGCPVGIPPPSN